MLVVIAFVVLPACFAAVLFFVIYGPVPARKRALLARSLPAPAPWAIAQAALTPAPAAAVAPAPEPVAARAPIERAAPPTPPPRPIPAMNPGLAPVVRHRAGDLPPLRRAARGTDAPPPLPAPRTAPRTAPAPVARASGTFERDEPTLPDR